jgi:hypothetical protein
MFVALGKGRGFVRVVRWSMGKAPGAARLWRCRDARSTLIDVSRKSGLSQILEEGSRTSRSRDTRWSTATPIGVNNLVTLKA